MKKKSIKRFARVGVLALAVAVTLQSSYIVCTADSAEASAPDYTYVSPEQQELNSSTNKYIRVDIDSQKANYTNTSTPYWNNWVVSSGTTKNATATYQGVTFTLSDSQGTGIAAGFNKKLIQSSGNTPRKTLDGVTGKASAGGDAVRLQISGLSAGTHSLTTWHSSWDSTPTNSMIGSSMSISADGTVKAASVPCPNSVTDDSEAGCAYMTFTVTQGQPVTVSIQSEDKAKNGELDAFEIDGPDPSKTISNVQPEEGNSHFDEQSGLSWQAGQGAVSHDVYLGTDFDSVNTATGSSAAFKGNQTATSYALDGLLPSQVYWWRVDEHMPSGEIVKGETRCFRIRHLAFPTAEGYGRFASGGRGGRVVEVTNLNDSGPGSLRQALEVDKGPRVVVFRVGGVIALSSRISIPSDGGDVYVAGQTAPGDGITVIQYPLGMYAAKDVVIRDIRLRVGDYSGKAMDGMGMANADNSIIDHCSISWTTDEGTSSRGAYNITFQKNIIAEALNDSVHYKDGGSSRTGTQCHSFAGSISGNVGSFYRNLLTNCTGRNWSMAGSVEQDGAHYAGYLDITNNVIYNFRDRMTDGGVRRVDFVNNYYKMGPESLRNLQNSSKTWTRTDNRLGFFEIDGNEVNYTTDMQKAYLNGNKEVDIQGNTVMDTGMEENWANVGNPKGKNTTIADVRSNTPFFPSYVTTLSADDAYSAVLNDVGANRPKQDYLDQRYVSEVKNGTYTYTGSKDHLKGIIDSQTDAGGYPMSLKGGQASADTDHDGIPDSWELKHGLNPNDANDGNLYTLSADGYTNLEMYLDQAAGDQVNWKYTSQKPVADNSAGSPSTAPEWPGNAKLAVTNATDSSASLTWTAAIGSGDYPITNYVIRDGNTAVATVDGNTTTCNVTGLVSGKQYNLMVFAVNERREMRGGPSAQVKTTGSYHIKGTTADGKTTASITNDDISSINPASNVSIDLDTVTIQAPLAMMKAFNSQSLVFEKTSPAQDEQSKISALLKKDSGTLADSFSINMDNGKSPIHELNGKVTVTVQLSAQAISKITNFSNVKLYYYNSSTGTLEDMKATFDSSQKTVTFTTDHLSTYAIGQLKSTSSGTGNTDSSSSAVSSGTGNTGSSSSAVSSGMGNTGSSSSAVSSGMGNTDGSSSAVSGYEASDSAQTTADLSSSGAVSNPYTGGFPMQHCEYFLLAAFGAISVILLIGFKCRKRE